MDIKTAPKVELHRHLDCSMRFSTMLDIARELDLKLPASVEEQKKFFLLTHPLENLGMVLGKFRMAQTLLYRYEVLERLAFECVQEAALENTRVLELRYSPTFIQDGHPNLKWDEIHQAFLRGIRKAQKSYDIAVGLIIIIQRTLPLETANSIVDFAINYKGSVVGIDLADNEDGYEATRFEAGFQRAKAAGLQVSVHAGEVPTPQSVLNVEHAILRLGATRIGHGIQSIKSNKVIKLLVEQKIPLEVCPTSNYLTQVVPKLSQHPLRALANEGVLLTLSTDDPGVFDYTLTQELETVKTVLGFSEAEIIAMQETAFRHSFIAAADRQRFAPLFNV